MDNCLIYTNETIIKELILRHVKVIAWLLHTTRIFQMSDLSLSDILKRKCIA